MIGEDAGTFDQPARSGQDQRHGHVGSVFRQYVRRVGDSDTLLRRRIDIDVIGAVGKACNQLDRSEEHTSELQSLMRISYAVFCLKKKKLYYKNVQYTTLNLPLMITL